MSRRLPPELTNPEEITMADCNPLLSLEPASSSISCDIHEWGPSPSSARTKSSDKWENRTLLLISLGCMISMATLLLNLTYFRQSYTAISQNKLDYPNPYIGLENAMLKDVTSPAPIMNFPLFLGQINMSDSAVADEDLYHWTSSFGTIYPEDRTFLVSSEASTIAQFRAIDFAMERCVLTLAVPSVEDQGTSGKKTISSPGPISLAIWALDSTDDMDPRTLSWFTRPARSHLLTTIIFSVSGYFESPPFSCPSRTLHTFEISCGTPECYLRFHQDSKPPFLAIFLMQHPSG
ncbi:hypothetical protein C8R45DRAFT_999949 [Mycena sanguinolenta]|nr:hypothetical protein C8R45DRAFT_999949 [Mycena sanguinolenta]